MPPHASDPREKLHDVELLRSRTRAHAKARYEKRWGKLTDADERTLDVEFWQVTWELGRKVEKGAQRHLAAITKALKDATVFVERCHHDGEPMGEAAQVLEQCVPALLRALGAIEQKRAVRLALNPAERPERSTWIRNRLHIYYASDDELAKADRQELAVLSLLAGWWPPKATGRVVRMHGLSVENAVALEADHMARARAGILRKQRELEEDPFVRKLGATVSALVLAERNLLPQGPIVRPLEAQDARRGQHDDSRPSDRAPHRGTRRV